MQKVVHGNSATATSASKCTGNSATATKLATARKITLSGAIRGSVSFDGSSDVTINAIESNIFVLSGTASFNSSGIATINYPSGFTKNNCVVVSFMTQGIGANKSWSTGSVFDSGNTINGSVPKAIRLTDSTIVISIANIGITNGVAPTVSTSYPNMSYKIVLLKVS